MMVREIDRVPTTFIQSRRQAVLTNCRQLGSDREDRFAVSADGVNILRESWSYNGTVAVLLAGPLLVDIGPFLT